MALILVAIGLLAVLLAWAYNIYKKPNPELVRKIEEVDKRFDQSQRIDNDEEISGAATNSSNVKTTNTFFGLGVDYELPNGLIVRGLYEDYGDDDGLTDVNSSENKPDQIDPNAMSLSLIKKF